MNEIGATLRALIIPVTPLGILRAAIAYSVVMGSVALGLWYIGAGTNDPFAPLTLSIQADKMSITQGESLPVTATICNESDDPVIVGVSSTWQDGPDLDPVIGPSTAAEIEPGCNAFAFGLPVSRSLVPEREWRLVLLVFAIGERESQTIIRTVGPINVSAAVGESESGERE